MMKILARIQIVLIVLLMVLLAFGCRSVKPLENYTSQRDSLSRLERIESHDLTVYIPLKPGLVKVTDTVYTNAAGKPYTLRPITVQNQYCTALAWVQNGIIHLSLQTKPDSLAYTIKDGLQFRYLSLYADRGTYKKEVVMVKYIPLEYKIAMVMAIIFVVYLAFRVGLFIRKFYGP